MAQLHFKIKSLSFVFLLLFVLATPEILFGQRRMSVTAGFNLPELLNFGLLYQIKQSQIGINIGYFPAYSYEYIPISANYYYHFAGSSKLTNLRPWYGMSGLLYLVDEDQYMMDKGLYLPLLAGRNFNLSKYFGLNFEIGLAFLLHNENTIKEYREYPYGQPEAGSLPCGGFAFFYRF